MKKENESKTFSQEVGWLMAKAYHEKDLKRKSQLLSIIHQLSTDQVVQEEMEQAIIETLRPHFEEQRLETTKQSVLKMFFA